MSKRAIRLAAFAFIAAAAGCSGSDGAQGPSGPQGPAGPPGPQITATTEECAGCHAASLTANHALSNVVTVSAETALTGAAADLTMTFNVKVDGLNRADFLNKQDAYSWFFDPAQVTTPGGVRTSILKTAYTVASTGNGNYTVTLPGFGPTGATPAATGTTFMFRLDTGVSSPQASVVAFYGSPTHDVVSDAACMNCHGTNVFAALHHSANPKGVEACLICHNRYDSSESRLGTSGVAGTATGTRLMGYVHGIHNSHNMAAGMNVDVNPDPATTVVNANAAGTYSRNGSTSASSQFSIGFPGFMNNCSTCHTTPTQLAAVANAPISWKLCMSCHNDWNGFAATQVGGAEAGHRTRNQGTNCATCHNGVDAPATIAAYHNGLKTERAGLLWDGADQSVVWGKFVKMDVTGVTFEPGSPGTLVVTWKAQWDPDGAATGSGFVDVDPCNNNYANGPVFHRASASAVTGAAAQNMSILKAYPQANDWVNGIANVTSPGQPTSVNLSSSNTTCAANVATTRVAADNLTAGAARAIVSLQGKPQIRFDPALGTSTEVIQVRSPSPTREYVPATGAVPATTRRQIVSVDKCNACHLGSLYQHGGNRVDRIELCVMCHNPASSEQQNRAAMGLDVTKTYDGRLGQTYDLRTMVHAIHAAGETSANLVYYRSNGVYAFGSKASIAAIPNWKTTPKIECAGLVEGNPGQVVSYMVYGSIPTGTVSVPTASGAGSAVTTDPSGACSTLSTDRLPAGYTKGTYRPFNEIPVEYPRALNDCSACHVGTVSLPNPNLAVAVTEEIGGTTASNLLDDVLVGPTTASCMSCHQSGDPTTQFQLKKHAYDQSWWPSAFPNGRQDLLDAVP